MDERVRGEVISGVLLILGISICGLSMRVYELMGN